MFILNPNTDTNHDQDTGLRKKRESKFHIYKQTEQFYSEQLYVHCFKKPRAKQTAAGTSNSPVPQGSDI